MRIGFLSIGLLLFLVLGLVFPSCLGDGNLAMSSSATAGEQPDSSLLRQSTDVAGSTLLSESEKEDTSTIYKWDEEVFDWVEIGELERLNQESNAEVSAIDFSNPVKVEWEELMNILYHLKYYPELDLSVFAPVFGPKLESMNGQTVLIEGYVLPIDEDEGLWALSAFPIASCFFCGQASPASVLSVYFSESTGRKRYKVGDKLFLSGTLVLNYDDPIELYYVLKEAEARAVQ
ncbi:MAG: hypothetical protein KTR30_17525 [Saprospiraceae bacterium]|nr:hypothetical protein [Saprospiraceae bacterium]